MVDYYNLLQVAPDAAPEALRAAYRREAKRWHPDAHPNLRGSERETAQRRFILVSKAYDTLSDPARRRDYDRQRGPENASGPRSAKPQPGRSGPASGAEAARPRPARPATGGSAGPEPDWNSLVSEVESLLGKFGLDLKQPAERLLETLLDWAKALFEDFLAAWNEEDAPAAPRGAAGSRSAGAAAKPAAQAHRDKTRTPEIESELAELKRREAENKPDDPSNA